MAVRQDINLRQGDTFFYNVRIWEDGEPGDLWGKTFYSEIRECEEDLLLNTGNLFQDGEVTSTFLAEVEDNILLLTLHAPNSLVIPPGRHRYDIQEIDSATDRPKTLIFGYVKVYPQISENPSE